MEPVLSISLSASKGKLPSTFLVISGYVCLATQDRIVYTSYYFL